jgi:hypothetical protein
MDGDRNGDGDQDSDGDGDAETWTRPWAQGTVVIV